MNIVLRLNAMFFVLVVVHVCRNSNKIVYVTLSASDVSESITVTASIPVQNQVAAQKLLQKTSQPNFSDRTSRSHRHRGRFEEEESHLLTLDEWERRKTGIHLPTTHDHHNISQDEDLARQLQEQFDLEDVHVIIFLLNNITSYGDYSHYGDRFTKSCFCLNIRHHLGNRGFMTT